MRNGPEAVLTRGREELRAARVLVERGFPHVAISRAYFAAFYAAEAALLLLGETRSKHAGVISAFEVLLVRQGQMAPEVGRQLRSLFRRRGEADYGLADIPDEAAVGAIEDAERVVDAVASWIERRRQ